VDGKKWVAGGDSERLLVAEDSRQSVRDSIQDFMILTRVFNFVGRTTINKRYLGELGREFRQTFKDND